MTEERRIERANEVGGADQQSSRLLAEGRDDLQKFIGHPLKRRGGLAAALGRDLLHLVDEHHRVFQLGDLKEGLAECPSQPPGVGGQPGREDLDERPLETRGDRFGEGGLAGAGRPEEHDGLRRHHPVLLGHIRLGQRHHQAPFQQLLLALHPTDALPEVAGQDASAQLAQ